MFLIFKNYVLYFSILSFIYATSPGDAAPQECTTISFKQRVEKEMGVFDEFANEISDVEKRGEFRGGLRQVVRRAMQADEYLKEQGALQKEKDMAEAKAQMYIIPLTVRAYATMIEAEFPDIMKDTSLVPKSVMDNTQPHSKHLVTRLYRWNKILKERAARKNKYVELIIEGLDKEFNGDKIGKVIDKESEEYKNFVLRFCDSIVKAIEFGNIIIAHGRYKTVVKLAAITEFEDNVVNRNMAVFYNSLVSSDIQQNAENLMKAGGLLPDENTTTYSERCFNVT